MSLLFLLFLLDTTYLDCVEKIHKDVYIIFFTMFDDFSKYLTTTNVLQNLENNQIWEDPTNIEFVFFFADTDYIVYYMSEFYFRNKLN